MLAYIMLNNKVYLYFKKRGVLMKKSIVLSLFFISAIFILTSCEAKKEVLNIGVNAEILEINEEEKILLVKGLDENSIIGDKSYVECKDAYFIELIDGKPMDIMFKDLKVGDKITVDVREVFETYPTSTTTERVQLIQRANTNYGKINEYMKEKSKDAFSSYYELLDFELSNYNEKITDGHVEATFFYKIIHKNYDKDPDTVEYIKNAKESGNTNYQQMYNEYLQPQDMNFDLKVVIHENNSITLYSNVSPNGIEWEETKMSDFIIKK
jgi:hypothetical protein